MRHTSTQITHAEWLSAVRCSGGRDEGDRRACAVCARGRWVARGAGNSIPSSAVNQWVVRRELDLRTLSLRPSPSRLACRADPPTRCSLSLPPAFEVCWPATGSARGAISTHTRATATRAHTSASSAASLANSAPHWRFTRQSLPQLTSCATAAVCGQSAQRHTPTAGASSTTTALAVHMLAARRARSDRERLYRPQAFESAPMVSYAWLLPTST